MSVKQKIISTFGWGFGLWVVGYLAGMVLYFVVPKEMVGWVITPFATLLTVWVVYKKIKRPELMCYFGLGLVWTVIAVVMDYVFIVKMLSAGSSYYQADVLLYYLLTFTLPMGIGYWKFKHKAAKAKLF